MARFEHRETLGAGDFAYPFGIGGFLVAGPASAPVLYATTLSGGGVTAFGPDGTGGLTVLGELGYPGFLAGGGAPVAVPFTVNGASAFLVAGLAGAAFVTGPGGAPASWTTFADGLGALAALAPLPGGLLLAAPRGGGLLVLGAGPGGPVPVSSLALDPVAAIARMPDGSLHAVSPGADTVTRLTLTEAGTLLPGQIAGAPDGLGWDAPSAVRVAEAGGTAHLLVAAAGSSSLTALTFDGRLYRVSDHVIDDRTTRFAGPVTIDSVSVNGRTFVAGGGADDGVTLFELLPGGRLLAIQSVEDTPERALSNVSAVALLRSGANLQLVAAGQEGGLSVFSRPVASLAAPLIGGIGADTLTGGAGDDLLIGRAGDDRLDGGAGGDVLWDGEGTDTMRGGAGADLFVFESDGRMDVIEDFEPGIDRLDLSAFPNLYAVASLSVVAVAGGARITYGDETIELRTAAGQALSAEDLTEADILSVTRPPLVQIGRDLAGTAGPDVLFGADGSDRLQGLGGNDTLAGLDGDDAMLGQDGDDAVDGGAGRDIGAGGTGTDAVTGGPGGDVLLGGPGNDVIEGGDGPDLLAGGSGSDRLDGGPGNDTLRGGAGGDVFVFRPGGGVDRIADFVPGEDAIDLAGRGGWAAVQGAIAGGSDGARIVLGGDVLLLTGLDPAALGADDFLF